MKEPAGKLKPSLPLPLPMLMLMLMRWRETMRLTMPGLKSKPIPLYRSWSRACAITILALPPALAPIAAPAADAPAANAPAAGAPAANAPAAKAPPANSAAPAPIPAGARLAATCTGCHGTNGVTAGDALPALAGQPKDSLLASLKAFKAGERPATVMTQLAKGYSDEQLDEVASFFAGQKVSGAGR